MKPVRKRNPMKVTLEVNTLNILRAIGYTDSFLVATERRAVRLDVNTGKPLMDENPTVEFVSANISGQIFGHHVFESKEDNLLVVAIVSGTITYYTVIKRKRAINFFSPYAINSAEGVVLNLLKNNYKKGPVFYRKTSNIVPGFLMKFLGAIYSKPTKIPMTVRALNNVDVETNIHFVPGEPHSCVLEVFNMVYNYSPNHFPRDQVNDALERHRLIEKLEATI